MEWLWLKYLLHFFKFLLNRIANMVIEGLRSVWKRNERISDEIDNLDGW